MAKNKHNLIKYSLIFFVLISCIASCKKAKDENNSGGVYFTQGECFSISGYTITNQQGDIIYPYVDSSDWRFDDSWSCEKNYFTDANYNTNCTFDTTNLHRTPYAFPNPTSIGYFQLSPIGNYSLPSDTNVENYDKTIKMEIVVINQRKEKIASYLTNKFDAAGLVVQLDSLDSLASDTIFRVYYKLIDQNNCVVMGHGDVVRQ
jgi:hypothetical protein